jgi:sugar transferase (PEP-CTERM/EpsH1 system associated)
MVSWNFQELFQGVEGIFYMRILFVIPHLPSSVRPRSFNLIKLLSAEHDFSLVAQLVDDYEREMIKYIQPYCASIDLVPLPRSQAYANCLRALPARTPLRVAYYRSPAFVQRIKEVIHRQKIDLVHGELIKVVPALKAARESKNIPIVYDSVDCNSWFLQQQFETTRNPLKKAFTYSELLKVCHYERRELTDFDQVIITGIIDRDRLERMIDFPHPVQVVGNGVDTGYFTPLSDPRTPNSLVFCAKLDYSPNAQAILYFCKKILPLVWKQRPDVRLTIVGNNPPPPVRALGSDERITVTGYVPDTRPYIGTAFVALAPLLVAAGTQNKILEALAMGTPVVTFPDCCRALGAEDGIHLLTANEPQAFADAILNLLADPELGQRLGRAGRLFVTEHYTWAAAAQTLNRLYYDVMARREQHVFATSVARHS